MQEVMREMVEMKERIARQGTWEAIESLIGEGWTKEKLERAGIRSVFFRDTKTSFNDNIDRLIKMTR